MLTRVARPATLLAVLLLFPAAVHAQFVPLVTQVLPASDYQEIQAGDLNNDGFTDVVIGAEPAFPNGTPLVPLRVLLGGPNGLTLVEGLPFSGGSIELADMDGDGLLDLIAVVRSFFAGERLEVHPGFGNGTFWFNELFSVHPVSNYRSFAAGDLNGNSIADLVYNGPTVSQVTIRYDDGATQVLETGASLINSIDIMRLNGPTIVVANGEEHRLITLDGNIQVFEDVGVFTRLALAVSDPVANQQQFRASPRTLFPPTGDPISLVPALGGLNLSAVSMTEVFATSPGQEVVITSFEDIRIIPAPYTTPFIIPDANFRDTAVGDFNGDGLRDLAMVGFNRVAWRLQAPQPVISAGPDQSHVANNFGQVAITLSGTSSILPQSAQWHEGSTLIGTGLTLQTTALIGVRTYMLTVTTPGFTVTDTVVVSTALPPAPPGPAGPTGPQGPTGPTGPAGTGAMKFTILRANGDTTIELPANGDSLILFVTTGRDHATITLPPGRTAAGRFVIIKRSDRGRVVTVRTQGNELIDAKRSSLRMENRYDTLMFVTDGNEWVLLSQIE